MDRLWRGGKAGGNAAPAAAALGAHVVAVALGSPVSASVFLPGSCPPVATFPSWPGVEPGAGGMARQHCCQLLLHLPTHGTALRTLLAARYMDVNSSRAEAAGAGGKEHPAI